MLRYLPFLLLLIWGCGDKKNANESIDAEYQTVAEVEPSVVSIPLKIEVAELEKLIDQQTSGLNMGGQGEDRRLDLKVSKADEPIKIEVFNDRVRYRVPLKLDIAYDLGITKPTAIGILAMDFGSRFTIDSSWVLSTVTKLNSHEWIEEPKINVGGFSLPITSIANYAVRQAEGSLERAIDQAVTREVSLQSYVTDAWNQLQKPILVSPEEQAWLLIRPTNLQMTPLQSSEKAISAEIRLEALPRLVFQENAPAELPSPFPAFSYHRETDEGAENFNLYLGSNITYEAAEKLAGASVVGETFSSGNKTISVDDLKLFGKSGKLMVEIHTTGAYNGAIFLSGVPEYDMDRSKLKIRDLDFTLRTKSFLTKTAAWLLKGKLKRKLQENMNEMLEDNLTNIRKELESQLSNQQLAPGVALNGKLDQLGLAKTYLTKDGIEVIVSIKGQLDLDISGLNQLTPNE